MKAQKTPTERLMNAQHTSCVQMPKNIYIRHLRSFKSICFRIPIHRPFSASKNNKQFLNWNQTKIMTDTINEPLTCICFRLDSHNISTNNYFIQSQQQKCQNKVWSPTSIWFLYRQSRTSHLTMLYDHHR